MDGLLDPLTAAPLSIEALVINLLIAIALMLLISWYYTRFGRSFSNRRKFAQNLVPLALITVLIISIVKSSLALSLGLVGALSIVRFRTAIKEPEELVYLFLAIAVGLGLGADQRWATVAAIVVIISFLFVRTLFTDRPERNNLYFNVQSGADDTTFDAINQIVIEHTDSAELHRLDHQSDQLQASYLIKVADDKALTALMDALRDTLPEAEFSFIEQETSLAG
jgi:hypothetical protein